jgi:hypothetical protein
VIKTFAEKQENAAGPRLPDVIFSNQKSQLGKTLEGLAI